MSKMSLPSASTGFLFDLLFDFEHGDICQLHALTVLTLGKVLPVPIG
jgi:hypothetical protein